ncbi:MAG TPA: cation-translocating P-type ATPase [Vicinamibacteria bacterium]|nr:cation-translocating P-type ATPase [Vicinamibacteria bacterium]
MSTAPACPGCEGEKAQTFLVDGLDCAAEVALIESEIGGLPGVCSVRASAVTGQATVIHTLVPGSVEAAFMRAGFRVREARQRPATPSPAAGTLLALGLTLAGAAVALFAPPAGIVLYLSAIVLGGAPIARKGLQRARQGVLDMNALMTVAVLGAMAIGEWGEGAATVVLFSLAQLLEARSMERARSAISGLLGLVPETALVRRAAGEERVAASEVARGEWVIVGPGERFALDGVVESGTSAVDQSPLTGESQPVAKAPGDAVLAGSINGSGALGVRVTRPAAETTLARILRRVEEAQSSRAASQGFVEAFARVYTPVVLALAAAAAVVPPLLGYGTFEAWAYRSLVLLVIACPCALVISTPVSIVSALTAASRRGVLVKGGVHLEDMGRVLAVVFDKTGTLTRGTPAVTDVLPARGPASEVLALAAAVESRCAHPVAAALVRHARREGIPWEPASDVVEFPGRGARGRVGAAQVLVGSHRLFDERGLCDHRLDAELARLEAQGKTVVLVGRLHGGSAEGDGVVLGAVAVADEVRPEAAEAVASLRRAGLRVAMLSGDNARTADAIAARLGIEESHADLLPEDKVAYVAEMERALGPVAMVGDGVNDAPALATATVGLAMGRRGSDVALETADIALMSEDLRRIPEAIRLARAARRVIRQNIALSLGVKAAVLALALVGLGSLWAAVAADMGASLLVIGNGMRLLRRGEA